MRGPSNWAVAVRTPGGTIAQVCRPIESAMAKHKLLRLPIVRGVIALGESLAIGFRALAISANYAAQEEDAEGDDAADDRQPEEPVTRHRRFDPPGDLRDLAVRLADGDGPDRGAAHHDALEDGLSSDGCCHTAPSF